MTGAFKVLARLDEVVGEVCRHRGACQIFGEKVLRLVPGKMKDRFRGGSLERRQAGAGVPGTRMAGGFGPNQGLVSRLGFAS